MKVRILIFPVLCFAYSSCGDWQRNQLHTPESPISAVWNPDLGNGTYKNPIIHADYSDPDVIRVREDFYLVSSSFNCAPGIPVLHSKDLVNWTIISHVFQSQKPDEFFKNPLHGNGVWAPSIRYHNGEFYIYYGDPDFGIFMTKARNPAGPWTEPLLVQEGKGWIDPCPFWDENGQAYLVHAWAGSRAGIKSILTLHKMSADGTKLLDRGVLIFDGHFSHPTVEGPKMYKRDGYYYIFAPAGGVSGGWQLALRSENIWGPYEEKIVLHQGNTDINGPHQGAWLDTPKGEDWFIHFQDKGAYGRIVHLQPMQWKNNWPVMGIDTDGDGTGEPVLTYKKPNVGKLFPLCTPQTSDEFNEPVLGLQWQWHANPDARWGAPSGNHGFLRLNAISIEEKSVNLYEVPNLLLQKFPAEEFVVTAKITFYPAQIGDKTGLLIMGEDYACLSLQNSASGLVLEQIECVNASVRNTEIVNEAKLVNANTLFLRVSVGKNAMCNFSYSSDSVNFIPFGKSFRARAGKWIGAKVGLFCIGTTKTNDSGYVNVDWFRIDKAE